MSAEQLPKDQRSTTLDADDALFAAAEAWAQEHIPNGPYSTTVTRVRAQEAYIAGYNVAAAQARINAQTVIRQANEIRRLQKALASELTTEAQRMGMYE